MTEQNSSRATATRRDFLKTSTALAVAGGVSTLLDAPAVHAAGSDVIRVGIIGCGGRGSGAAENVLQSAKGVCVVALGDYFQQDERRRGVGPCRQRLIEFAEDPKVKELGNKVDLPQDRCFTGLEAYKKVIESGVDYVILATPPGFRPLHLEAAVRAGKHVFTEKPVAVDGAGIRKCLDVYEDANKKKLGIAAGTQRRHQAGYLETIKQIHDGTIGDILSARSYWNTGPIWFRPRKEGQTDLDYQVHNWYHFVWLCGDHICEQHVHNLDVINWATKSHPARALGMGGRVRPCSDPKVDGHIFNYFAVEYQYDDPKGLHMLSMCRQVDKSDVNFPNIGGVSEALVGSKGVCQVDAYTINGKPVYAKPQERKLPSPYVQEHTNLIASIRAGKPINELKNVSESTLTAIMGRMSAYTGKVVTWDQALGSKEKWMPDNLVASSLPVPDVAVPGKTPLQ